MKAFYLLLAAVVIQIGNAFAQTLTPVGSGGFDLWPIIVIAIVGGGGYALYIWHKRNPSKADAAIAAAKADAIAVGQKALNIADGLRQTVEKQAAVIASPPVQAVINAPAPTSVTPAPLFAPAPPVQVSAPAPAPVAAPAPPADPAAVQYYDGDGTPNPKGMYQAYQLKAVMKQQQQYENTVATGPLDLGALESGDKAYLVAMGEAMSFDPRALVRGQFYGVVSSELGKDTFPEMGAARFSTLEFEKTVTPGVVQVVRELAQGTGAWIPAAFVSWGGPAYVSAHQPAWSLGWTRVHGAPA